MPSAHADGLHGATARSLEAPSRQRDEREKRRSEDSEPRGRSPMVDDHFGRTDELVQAQSRFALKSTDGENVGDDHDDKRDEERHKEPIRTKLLSVSWQLSFRKTLVVIMQAKDRDRHGDNLRQMETK